MNLKKLLSVATLFVAGALGFNANAQASYNFTYDEGVAVAEGENYFLYNLGAQKFLTDGMDWGTHATVDNAGRVITFASLAEGKYNIYTKSYSVNNGAEEKAGYMTLNGYLDTGENDANWEFTPVTVDNYTNVYTIKHSDTQYLIYNSADSRVNVGESTGDNYSYWMIIPKTARDKKKDYSYYLQNTDFNRPWQRVIWINEAGFSNQSGGLDNNKCAEVFHKSFDMYQTISASIPNGKYIVYNQGFYRKDDGEEPAYLYANKATSTFGYINANGENTAHDMNGASTSFSAGFYVNSVTTVVTDNKLTVGVKNSNANNWVIFDNFFLSYVGTTLINDAVALPENGEMNADTWYYFDIPATAEYNISTTTLDDVVYTTDGAQITGEATGEKFAATTLELSASRYYIKSSSANTFSVSTTNYVYTLGEATPNIGEGSYISELTTFVVTFPNAASNNPEATLATIGSTKATLSNGSSIVAEGYITADNATKALTATFTDVTLDLNSTYTITIPAGVFGYEGEATNEEVSVNFNTPAIAEGYYYMYNAETKKYLSRGGVWATSAILDDWGLAVYLKTDVKGNTSIKYFDSQLYLCDNEYCYTDAGEDNGRKRYFKVSSVEGGYNFLNTSNNKLLAVENGVAGAKDGLTSNVWQLVTPADHHANNSTRNADAQATATAVAATEAGLKGLSEVTTVLALESYLEKLGSEPVDITGTDEEKYEVYASQKQDLEEAEYYKETVPGLKPGLYKLSVDAFQRAGWKENVAEAEGARGSIYVYANEAKTQIKSFMEYGADEPYGEGWPNYAYNGKNYPNDHTAAKNALKTGNYRNDVYVYVADKGDGTGSLTFGINNPNRLGDNVKRATWAVYNNFSLTYYGTEVKIAVKANKYSTFIAPFDVTIPEGVTASKVADTEGEILVFEGLEETIPANTPVVLYSENGCEETFIGTDLSTDVTYTVGLLTGTYEKSITVPAGSYVLQTQDNGQKFYLVGANTTFKMPNRAYLTVPTESAGVKAFSFGGETTGINGVETLTDGAVESIFTISGARVNSLQKGLNIVKMSNGKVQKVLVK